MPTIPATMVFDRDQQARLLDGVWRDYDNGVKSRIRPLTKQLSRSFREQASRSGRFDEELFDRLLWDHLVAEWNIEEVAEKDADGKVTATRPMPCTVENKILIINSWQGYRNWAAMEADTLGEKLARVERAQLGNSGSSPAGKRTAPETETSPSAAPAAG